MTLCFETKLFIVGDTRFERVTSYFKTLVEIYEKVRTEFRKG